MAQVVVIVGTGLAGVCAALSVLESHSKAHVLMLDKCEKWGGNSMRASSGISALGGPDDCVHRMIQDVYNGQEQDMELVQTLVKSSSEGMAFLEKYSGINLQQRRVQLGGHQVPRTYRGGVGAGNIGSALMKPLLKTLQRNDRVTFRKAHVIAINSWGPPQHNLRLSDDTILSAEYLILATGGFAANVDWIHQLNPSLCHTSCTTSGPQATGDLVRTLVADKMIGTIGLAHVQEHPTGFVDPRDPGAVCKILCPEVMRSREVGGKLINKLGLRFVDETLPRDQIIEAMHREPHNHFTLQVSIPRAEKVLGTGSVSWYQHKGLIDKFGEAHVVPAFHYCMGGIRIDKWARVLDQGGNVIPKVWACGEVTGGLHGHNRLAGCSLLDCVVFGIKAGQLFTGSIDETIGP